MSRMMKHMDNAFRERLRDMEIAPPENNWNEISSRLKNERKKQWMFFTKMAAALAILIATTFILYTFFNETGTQTASSVTETNHQKSESTSAPNLYENNQDNVFESDNNASSLNKNNTNTSKNDRNRFVPADIQQESIAQVVGKNKGEAILFKSDLSNDSFELEEKNRENKLATADEAVLQKQNRLPGYISDNLVAQTSLEYNQYRENEEVEKTRKTYWEFIGNYGSVYSDRLITSTQLSPDEKAAMNVAESGLNSFGGGLGFRYNVDRWSFESGLFYSRFGQSNKQILTESTPYNRNYEMAINKGIAGVAQSEYLVNNSLGVIAYNSSTERVTSLSVNYVQSGEDHDYSGKEQVTNSPVEAMNVRLSDANSNIIQRVHFLEIPLMMRYKVIDKNFIMSLSGGFGANVVTGSEVVFEKQNDEKYVGKISHINELNVSSTFGIGFGYVIHSDVTFHIEPAVKVFLNSLNHGLPVNFYPYQIGVFTGFTYAL